ncbi:MAG TPA: hypothetical protein VL486_12065 [Verrucomicrobiae bacterium]|nr:hypothetical protein [Verrucomicrobiae bacterium]
MAISNISRDEFNRIFTFDSELAPYIGEEVEWYADEAKNVIGVIAKGVSGSCWSYAILRRNGAGDFVAAALGRDFFVDLQIARAACLRQMAASYGGEERVVAPSKADGRRDVDGRIKWRGPSRRRWRQRRGKKR